MSSLWSTFQLNHNKLLILSPWSGAKFHKWKLSHVLFWLISKNLNGSKMIFVYFVPQQTGQDKTFYSLETRFPLSTSTFTSLLFNWPRYLKGLRLKKKLNVVRIVSVRLKRLLNISSVILFARKAVFNVRKRTRQLKSGKFSITAMSSNMNSRYWG